MNIEIWKPLFEYEGLYEISSLGRIRRVIGAIGTAPGYILKGGTMNRGYKTVRLCRNPKDHKTFKLSRLVCHAFHGKAPTHKHQVNHKNGIIDDDRAGNLEWMTPQENTRHRFDVLKKMNARGEQSGNAVLTEEKVHIIRALAAKGCTSRHIAQQIGAKNITVKQVVSGKNWSHLPFKEIDISSYSIKTAAESRKYGREHPIAKLNERKILQIRRRAANGERGSILAKEYGVTQTLIIHIVKRKIWRHVA